MSTVIVSNGQIYDVSSGQTDQGDNTVKAVA